MRHLSLALAALLIAALAAACTDPIPAAPPELISAPLEGQPEETIEDRVLALLAERAEISIEGSTAYYTGVINDGSASDFLSIVRDAETAIDTLIINSGGGVTTSARRIGRWIHEHGVTVVVDELCFSSCANYIFTAAPKKIIRNGAYVGWHGSEQQDRYITVTSGGIDSHDVKCNTAEQIADDAPRSSNIDGQDVIIDGRDAADEEKFLDQIGVSVDALLYGMMPAQCEHYLTAGVFGWSFSIEHMAQFGITNVTYEGDEYPAPHRSGLPPIILYDLDGGPHRLFGAQSVDR